MSGNHKQKILMIHNYYQIPGGEDTVVANEKKLLEDHGHEVVLYSRHNNELKSMGWVQKLGLPFTTIFNPRTYREVKRIIKEQGIEIVHVHNTLSLISPSVYYAAVKCGVPVVQTFHNFRFLCPGAVFYRAGHICEDCVTHGLRCAVKHKCYRGSRIQTLICVINTWIHRHTGILGKINYICLTEFNRGKLLQLKQIKPETVFIKPNFTFENITEKSAIKKSGFIYAGRLDESKGVKFLFEAWKAMGGNAPKLIVCGTGPLEAWCREYIYENNLSSIEMRGEVDNGEVKMLMDESEALVLPTLWYEGFPMTIVEAYEQGTFVIVPDLGNAGDLVEESVTGFKYQYGLSDAFIHTIHKAEKTLDEEGIAAVNKRIQDYFSEKYSPETNYQLLSGIYKHVEQKNTHE